MTRESPIGFLNKEGNEEVWMEERYKLIVDHNDVRLFDISADPAEKSDLSNALPEDTKRMKAELKEWKEGVMRDLEIVSR